MPRRQPPDPNRRGGHVRDRSRGSAASNDVARRSQSLRRLETQNALLDATIDCLVELGYSGTTTRIVADRARVSRGAQTHYYPTKGDLVVASVEHLFDKLASQFKDNFEAVDAQGRTFERAIEELWKLVNGSTYAAVLEVIVAARTDEHLRVVVHGVAARLEQTVIELLLTFFPDIEDPELARSLVNLGFTVVQGAAVSSYAGFGDPELMISQLRIIASMVTPAAARDLAEATGALRARTSEPPGLDAPVGVAPDARKTRTGSER